MNKNKFDLQKDIKGGWALIIIAFFTLFLNIFYEDLKNVSLLPIIATIVIFSTFILINLVLPLYLINKLSNWTQNKINSKHKLPYKFNIIPLVLTIITGIILIATTYALFTIENVELDLSQTEIKVVYTILIPAILITASKIITKEK